MTMTMAIDHPVVLLMLRSDDRASIGQTVVPHPGSPMREAVLPAPDSPAAALGLAAGIEVDGLLDLVSLAAPEAKSSSPLC